MSRNVRYLEPTNRATVRHRIFDYVLFGQIFDIGLVRKEKWFKVRYGIK